MEQDTTMTSPHKMYKLTVGPVSILRSDYNGRSYEIDQIDFFESAVPITGADLPSLSGIVVAFDDACCDARSGLDAILTPGPYVRAKPVSFRANNMEAYDEQRLRSLQGSQVDLWISAACFYEGLVGIHEREDGQRLLVPSTTFDDERDAHNKRARHIKYMAKRFIETRSYDRLAHDALKLTAPEHTIEAARVFVKHNKDPEV